MDLMISKRYIINAILEGVVMLALMMVIVMMTYGAYVGETPSPTFGFIVRFEVGQ